MPTYEYACTECGDRLEVVQSFSDDPLTVCPSCQGKLRKLFSPVGVVFKGSGFYKTDSRGGKSTPTATGAGAAKESTSTGTDTSSTPASTSGSSDSASSTTSSEKVA